MACGDNNYQQLTIVDFVNDTEISDSYAPGWPAFQFLHVCRARVDFQFNKPFENSPARLF